MVTSQEWQEEDKTPPENRTHKHRTEIFLPVECAPESRTDPGAARLLHDHVPINKHKKKEKEKDTVEHRKKLSDNAKDNERCNRRSIGNESQ